MKKVVFLLIALAVMGVLGGQAQASMSFYAVDGGDPNITVTLTMMGGAIPGYTPLYSTDNGATWNAISVTTITVADMTKISIGLDGSDSGVLPDDDSLNSPTLNFINPIGGGLYQVAQVTWAIGGGFLGYEVTVANNCGDGFKPVPIPPSALLLGSSLLGMVGFGLRRQRQA